MRPQSQCPSASRALRAGIDFRTRDRWFYACPAWGAGCTSLNEWMVLPIGKRAWAREGSPASAANILVWRF